MIISSDKNIHIDDVICSIVIPFRIFNDNVVDIIKKIKTHTDLSVVELVFVIGDFRMDRSEIETKIKTILGTNFVLLQDKEDGSGPSRCWCLGLKAARGKYVCFIATDTIIDKNWFSALLSELTSHKVGSFFVGNISGSINNNWLSIIEKAIDQRRFDSSIVDFRNFVGERKVLLEILTEYFAERYFSDVELDFILKHQFKSVPIKVPEMVILNRYPETLTLSLQRKLKHGIGYGRICKVFIDKYRKFRTFGLYEFILAIKILSSETWCAKLSLSNKFVLFFLNMIFMFGMSLGICLPAKFARKYYKFHFDE